MTIPQSRSLCTGKSPTGKPSSNGPCSSFTSRPRQPPKPPTAARGGQAQFRLPKFDAEQTNRHAAFLLAQGTGCLEIRVLDAWEHNGFVCPADRSKAKF